MKLFNYNKYLPDERPLNIIKSGLLFSSSFLICFPISINSSHVFGISLLYLYNKFVFVYKTPKSQYIGYIIYIYIYIYI